MITDLLYLRSHERGCVTRGHQQTILSPELFGKTKITYPDAFWESTVIRVANVTGLQVSMHNLRKGKHTHTHRLKHKHDDDAS